MSRGAGLGAIHERGLIRRQRGHRHAHESADAAMHLRLQLPQQRPVRTEVPNVAVTEPVRARHLLKRVPMRA